MKTIWNKQTGEARAYEAVDAREILKNSPNIYTDVDPGKAKDPDGDGKEGGPQNVANVENEFRREPVGDDVPAPEREGTIIRNPVTDQPRMAIPAEGLPNSGVPATDTKNVIGDREASRSRLDEMTVAQMKDYAASKNIDLKGATLKDDVRAAIEKGEGRA